MKTQNEIIFDKAIELEPILTWLEDTTEFVIFYDVVDNYLYLNISLERLKIDVILNTLTNNYEWRCNYKIKLGTIDYLEELFISLRIYYDNVYKTKTKRKIKVWKDHINK